MPSVLRKGAKGSEVRSLQRLLSKFGETGVIVDGHFGEATEDALMAYQAQYRSTGSMLVDGIAGRQTWRALAEDALLQAPAPSSVVRVELDPYDVGYSFARLHPMTAQAVTEIRQELNERGGILTSSGGTRALSVKANGNQSATSFHYTGRALDTFVYSGMVDPETDPYVVVKDPDHARYWIVYARVQDGEEMELDGYMYSHEIKTVTGTFVNLTEMFKAKGMERIPYRKPFERGVKGSAEFWHHQDERGLLKGETLFAEILSEIYTYSQIKRSHLWDNIHLIFGIDFG